LVRDLRRKACAESVGRYDARMRTTVAIALAGALGALARWDVGAWFGQRFPTFPWGTIVINVSGSLVLGVLFALLVERGIGSPTMRLALMTGLLGAYTTFSTFSLETFRLLEDGAVRPALANVGLSVVLGLVAVWIGVVAGRAVWS
jgi:CrcB protein